MARTYGPTVPRKKSDPIYNARRRYRRAAERYIEKAEQAIGSERERFEILAKDAIENAIRTYEDKSKIQGAVKRVAERLGVTRPEPVSEDRRAQLVGQSYESLASAPLDKNAEAKRILKYGNIAGRFYGGLSHIWEDLPYSQRDKAIMEFFGVDNLLDAMDIIRNEWGINLYEAEDNTQKYREQKEQVRNRAFDYED